MEAGVYSGKRPERRRDHLSEGNRGKEICAVQIHQEIPERFF